MHRRVHRTVQKSVESKRVHINQIETPDIIYVAKAALFNESGELLLLRRASGDAIRPGELDIPGGSIDEGENPEQAVIREIEEETGLKVSEEDIMLGYTETSDREDKVIVRFLFIGRASLLQQITLSHEHQGYAWLPFDQASVEFDHPVWIGGLNYLRRRGFLSQ